jgi:F420-0:gamma-glutamyl ligase
VFYCAFYIPVDELNKKMGNADEGLPVVVIQFAKIKIFRGNIN